MLETRDVDRRFVRDLGLFGQSIRVTRRLEQIKKAIKYIEK